MYDAKHEEGNWIKVRYKRHYSPETSPYKPPYFNPFNKGRNNFRENFLSKKCYKTQSPFNYMESIAPNSNKFSQCAEFQHTYSLENNSEKEINIETSGNFTPISEEETTNNSDLNRNKDIQNTDDTKINARPPFFHHKKRWNGRKFETKPIMSYGIILFTVVKDSESGENIPYFLVSQRRDTIEYVDFIRGQYTDDLLEIFFSRMSTVERERLLSHSFMELWNDLWINKEQIHPETFTKANYKFHKLKERIPFLIESTNSELTSPPWGFPKGKRNLKETNMDCALREFSEETRIDLQEWDKKVVSYKPAIEIYKGSNGKMYGTNYFIIYVSSFIPFEKMETSGIRNTTISEELGDLKWLSINEAAKVLNNRRTKLLEYVLRIIRKNGYI